MKTKNLQDISDLNQLVIAIFLAFVLMSLVLILFFYFSRKKIVQKEIEKRDLEISHQTEIIKSIVSTQEVERKRIAQDLHDDISSKLNIVSLNSHLLQTPDLSKVELTEISNNIINLTKSALDNSRQIAHDLFPPVFQNFGLDKAIQELCLEIENASAIKIKYTNSITFDILNNDRHLHVFRILQELINNSIRHGKSSEISIDFYEKNNQNACKFKDNGVGFNPKILNTKKGLGMKNIESRITFLNGKMDVKSDQNMGVEFIFSFE